jgi:malate permease and related proteins
MQSLYGIISIYLLIALGFITGKFLKVGGNSLSKLVVYIFFPALIFISVLKKDFTGTELLIPVIFIFLCIFVGICTLFIGKILKISKERNNVTAALTSLVNTGNYGIPFCVALLGEGALPLAGLITLGASIVSSTWGVYILSSGRKGFIQSIAGIFKLPPLYAFFAAVFLKHYNFQIPDFIFNPINSLNLAYSPVALTLLGIFLSQVQEKHIFFKPTSLVILMKLIFMPAIAFVIAYLLKLPSFIASIFILESAMPSALNTINLCSIFKVQPKFASGIVFFTIIFSLVTLTTISFLL